MLSESCVSNFKTLIIFVDEKTNIHLGKRDELGTTLHSGVYVYSVPWYAKVTVTQHANNLGYLPNWQTDSEMSSNTIPGIELSTPEFGHYGDTSGDLTVERKYT